MKKSTVIRIIYNILVPFLSFIVFPILYIIFCSFYSIYLGHWSWIAKEIEDLYNVYFGFGVIFYLGACILGFVFNDNNVNNYFFRDFDKK